MIFRTLIAIFALCFFARAQNVKTVMADTNGVIQGNAALEARIATGGTGAASTNDLAALSNRVVAVEASTNNWNTAYGWGNHATAGYLTSFTEADPFFTSWRSTNTYVKVEVDPLFFSWLGTNAYVKSEVDPRLTSWLGTNSYVRAEVDPLWSAWLGTNSYVRAEVDPLWSAWLGTNDYVKVELDATALTALTVYSSTNQVKRLYDSQSTNYFQTVENGTGTTWVITGPFTNLLSVTLSEDFLELGGSSRPTWTNHVFPFVQEPWIGTTSAVTPYATLSFNDGDALWEDISGSGLLGPANANAQGTAALIPEHTYCTTSIYSTFATEATVSNVNANLQACYVSISNQIEALPASLQPHTLTAYGSLTTTNTAGYAGFIATNGALATTLITDPTAGQLLAQFWYDVVSVVYGTAEWSTFVGSGLGTPASSVYANLKYYSAGATLVASNRGDSVVMPSSGAVSNIVASLGLPYAVTNGYFVAEIYSDVSTTKDLTVRTGGSATNTLSVQARPLGYLTPAEAAAAYTTPESVTNIVLDQQQVLATLYGYGSTASSVAGAYVLTNALPMTPMATVTNLSTTNNAYVAKFITGTGIRFSRIAEGMLDVHFHHRKGAAGACTLRPEFYLLDADGNKVVEFDAGHASDPLTVALGDSTIPIPIPTNLTITASNRIGVFIKAQVTSGTPDVYIDTEDNVNFIVSVPVPSAEFATQSDLVLKADKSTTLTIGGVTGNLSTNNTWVGGSELPDGIITNNQTSVSFGTASASQFRQIGGYSKLSPQYANSGGSGGMSITDGGAFFSFAYNSVLTFNLSYFGLSSTIPLGWMENGADASNPDTAFSRVAPGVVALGTGSQGNSLGSLQLSTLTASGTNTASVLRSQGAVLIGPTIDGKQAHIFTDGTNTMHVDVNGVTNMFAFDTIIKPVVTSGTNVVIVSTQSVYSVAVTDAGPVGIDWSALALDGTSRAEVTLRLNVSDWGGTNVTFAPSLMFDATPEILVTGVWEFAASTIDGVTTRVSQTWPACCGWQPVVITVAGVSSIVGSWWEIPNATTNYVYWQGVNRAGLVRMQLGVISGYAVDVNLYSSYAAAGNTTFSALGVFQSKTLSFPLTSAGEYSVSIAVPQPVYPNRGVKIWVSPVGDAVRISNLKYRDFNANERAAYTAGWRP